MPDVRLSPSSGGKADIAEGRRNTNTGLLVGGVIKGWVNGEIEWEPFRVDRIAPHQGRLGHERTEAGVTKQIFDA